MIIWFVPGFFALFGVLLTLFARPFVAFVRQNQQTQGPEPAPGALVRGVAQARLFGIAFLATAAVFVVLILADVL